MLLIFVYLSFFQFNKSSEFTFEFQQLSHRLNFDVVFLYLFQNKIQKQTTQYW